MMKRILATLMAMLLCLSLVAGAMAEELTVESLGVEFLVPDGDMIPDIPEEYDGHKTMSVPAFAATLTPEELQQVHDGNYTAVFCTFDAQSAWGRAMVNAVTNTLAALNMYDPDHIQPYLIEAGAQYSIRDYTAIVTQGEGEKGLSVVVNGAYL